MLLKALPDTSGVAVPKTGATAELGRAAHLHVIRGHACPRRIGNRHPTCRARRHARATGTVHHVCNLWPCSLKTLVALALGPRCAQLMATSTLAADFDSLAVLHALGRDGLSPKDADNAAGGIRHMASHAIIATLKVHKAEFATLRWVVGLGLAGLGALMTLLRLFA